MRLPENYKQLYAGDIKQLALEQGYKGPDGDIKEHPVVKAAYERDKTRREIEHAARIGSKVADMVFDVATNTVISKEEVAQR